MVNQANHRIISAIDSTFTNSEAADALKKLLQLTTI